MHIAMCDDVSRLAAEPNGVVITSGGEVRKLMMARAQSPAGLLPLLRRDSGVRCIVQRGSHRQLLAEEAVCPAVARSGAA